MTWATILVPLDGSPLAEAALPYADAIARATGAPLRLLTVLDAEADTLAGRPAAVRTHLEQATQAGTEQYLELTATMLRAWGRTVTTVIRTGRPAAEILAAAAEDEVALIVMATHGRGGVQRLIIGSVADQVLRQGTRPTLLVGSAEPPGTPQPRELRRILLPLDGSALGAAALPLAIELAQAAGATLTLLRVEPWHTTLVAPADLPGSALDLARLDTAAEEAAQAYLDSVCDRLPDTVHAETVVLRGPAATTLVDYVQRERVDLVVMSTHGRGGLRRLVMGSTADRLVRSHLPVLLVRPGPAQALEEGRAHQ